MSNDNDKENSNVIQFRPKVAGKISSTAFANVFIKGGMVGVTIPDNTIYLTPEAAMEFCFVILTALRVLTDIPDPTSKE